MIYSDKPAPKNVEYDRAQVDAYLKSHPKKEIPPAWAVGYQNVDSLFTQRKGNPGSRINKTRARQSL